MLSGLLTGEIQGVLLVFARLGAAFMLLPGFGERYVFARYRLLLALVASAVLAATLKPQLPALPDDPAALALVIGRESAVGILIGFTARFFITMLSLAGTLLALHSGLAAASFFDPMEAAQGTLPATLVTLVATTALFAGDGHLLLLRGLAASYGHFPAGTPLPLDDAAAFLTALCDTALGTGLRLAAPLVLVTLLANLLLGLMSRVMPALQVFALVVPLQTVLYLGMSLVGIAGALAVSRGWLDALLRSPVLGG